MAKGGRRNEEEGGAQANCILKEGDNLAREEIVWFDVGGHNLLGNDDLAFATFYNGTTDVTAQ